MLPSEYIPILIEAEQRYPVESWVAEDMEVWPILKVGLGFRLDAYAQIGTKDALWRHGINLMVDLWNYARTRLFDRPTREKINSVDFVFHVTSTERTLLMNGKWHHSLCEPIFQLLLSNGYSNSVFEASHQGAYRTPRREWSLLVQPFLNIIAVRNVLVGKKIDTEKFEKFDAFVAFIFSKTGLARRDIEKILARSTLIRDWAQWYKSCLKQNSAKAAGVVSYYGPVGMAFTLACKELGIKVFDLQHGVQGKAHVAYGQWTKLPNSGYKLIPDFFWCWDQNSADAINKGLSKSGFQRAFDLGHPTLDEFRSSSSEITRYFEARLPSELERSDRKIVLVTLQSAGLNDLFRELIVASKSQFFWLIRFHPSFPDVQSQALDFLATLGSEYHWEADFATRLPLAILMQRCDLHLTEFSSSIIEADSLGVPSVATHLSATELYTEQLEKGTLLVAQNFGEISKYIDSFRGKSPLPNKNATLSEQARRKRKVDFLTNLLLNEPHS